jgi:methionyl-tRNA formyltransferase
MIDISHKTLPLRVLFWGYHWSGWETYLRLKQSKIFTVVGVILPSNREHESLKKFKEDAIDSAIPYFEPVNLAEEEFVGRLKKLNPDIHFVDSYSKLIPSRILDITGLGFNLHPGLLPQYRGAHVLNWALVNGEQETGLSLHLLTGKFDEGAVVAYSKTDIALTDTAFELDKKLIRKIPELISAIEQQIERGKIEYKSQEGPERHWPARTSRDSEIKSSDTAMQAHNKVRALSYPWGGAYIYYGDIKMIIWQSMPLEVKSEFPVGSLIENGDELFYIASDHKILHIISANSIGSEVYRPLTGSALLTELKRNGLKVLQDLTN